MDVAQLLWTAVTDHPYPSLGLLVLVEGPAATVFGGSLVGAGLVAFWPILLIVVVADVTADSVLLALTIALAVTVGLANWLVRCRTGRRFRLAS